MLCQDCLLHFTFLHIPTNKSGYLQHPPIINPHVLVIHSNIQTTR